MHRKDQCSDQDCEATTTTTTSSISLSTVTPASGPATITNCSPLPAQSQAPNCSTTTVTPSSVSKNQSFGWYRFHPKCLQRFCNAKWALFWLCCCGAIQGLIVNGFINVVISTIEKRFGLRSSQTGFIASGYDIASFVCVVPVTYFGGSMGTSKPYIIAWGIVLLGLGSLTFSLPHFMVGEYRAMMKETHLCTKMTINSTSVWQQDEENTIRWTNAVDGDHLSWTMWLFFIAQLLHGAGAAPLFTLGVTYIDENVSKKMSSIYLGIFYTMSMIGPAMGYVIGGQLLRIYTDFLTIDIIDLGLTSSSRVWVGAWWLGFVFTAMVSFLLAIPLFAYPASLPGSNELQKQKISEAHNGNTSTKAATSNFKKLKDLPLALASLLKNPTFFFLNLAGASEGLIINGFAVFLPKQIENQFSISPIWSALLLGLVTIPAGGGGTFLGGYFVKKFNLTCSSIIKMCVLITVLATLFTSSLLLSCPNMAFAGVTTRYQDNVTKAGRSILSSMNMQSSCNGNCSCLQHMYDPICGVDGVMYYNPCYAGCTKESFSDDIKLYSDCECILDSLNSRVRVTTHQYHASNTMCTSDCKYLPYFVALCCGLMFLTFLATMPALSATLRCVYDDQRSLALGIQWIKVRLLGTIPAPMLFGAIIDETCILWQHTGSDDQTAGACLIYENINMSRYMWILALSGKLCSVLFFFASWWFYIPPKEQSKNLDNVTECNLTNGSLDKEKVLVVSG